MEIIKDSTYGDRVVMKEEHRMTYEEAISKTEDIATELLAKLSREIISTHAELKRRKSVINAFYKEGKKIECIGRYPEARWHPCAVPIWTWATDDYRIAESPKLRPWKPEEAIGKVIRDKTNHGTMWLVIEADESQAYFNASPGVDPYSVLLEDYEYLDVNGTWKPCGVEE